MKKVINGYIARAGGDLIFSDKPMKQDGFYGDGGVWYSTIEYDDDSTVDLRADIHEFMDIPELTEKESPRKCTITIEVGDFVGEKVDPDFMQKRGDIMKSIRKISAITNRSFKEEAARIAEAAPEIREYIKDKLEG